MLISYFVVIFPATVSMSAVCSKLLVALCLSWMMMMMMMMLTEAESDKVVFKRVGEDFTIQCRYPQDPDTHDMELTKGLIQEDQLFYTKSNSKEPYKDSKRLQIDGVFPNIDFFIPDLKVEDTGPYWCVYSKLNRFSDHIKTKAQGSVMLVVTGECVVTSNSPQCLEPPKDARSQKRECEGSNYGLALVAVTVSLSVIIFITTFLFLWIIYRRTVRTTVKQSIVHTSDVYEDMRATTRRVNI